MASDHGWAWKRDGHPLILWIDLEPNTTVGPLAVGRGIPSPESTHFMARLFGPGRWAKVQAVEVTTAVRPDGVLEWTCPTCKAKWQMIGDDDEA